MTMKGRTLLLGSLLLVTAANAWQLPSFLTENLPLFDPTVDFSPVHNAPSVAVVEPDHRRVQKGTDAPTDMPTESPAPSPSPSEVPTETPTVTAKPTPTPTEMPTESPAPSPSPSEIPTIAPSSTPSDAPTVEPTVSAQPSLAPSSSPTSMPSDMPSLAPSSFPTVSMMPSVVPSDMPSQEPSMQPSISLMPSTAPSSAPSVSLMPSQAPTHITEVSHNFKVYLPLEKRLNQTQTVALEQATVTFVENLSVPSGGLQNCTVEVTDQEVVEIDTDDGQQGRRRQKQQQRKRGLQDYQALDIVQQLLLEMDVTADYVGSDIDFNLKDFLKDEFKDPLNPDWLMELTSADPVFNGMTTEGDDQSGSTTASESDAVLSGADGGGGGVSSGGIAAATILAICAMAVGVAAAVYSMRHHKQSVYGSELDSIPSNESNNRPTQMMSGNEAKNDDDDAISWKVGSNDPPMSPNSLEQGKSVPMDQILKPQRQQQPAVVKSTDSRDSQTSWGHIVSKSSSGSRAKDPPAVENNKNDARKMESLADNNTELSELSQSRVSEVAQVQLTRNFLSDPNKMASYPHDEIPAARSEVVGAKAASNAGSGFSGSDFSSHAMSFFGMSGGGPKPFPGQQKQQPPAPASLPEQHKLRDVPLEPEEDSLPPPSAGLYDVFAPAGPIGVVVDTTKHGPSVHSLKRTSPMLGLINPGDLIVGLDDEDTRGMTAATLTRLMARKSSQKERKITLLTTETY